MSNRNTPEFIMIDSNLHHFLWNPPQCLRSHPKSFQLLKMCGKKGFTLISPKKIPALLVTTGQPTINHISQGFFPTTHHHENITLRPNSKTKIKISIHHLSKTRQ
ncbi:hypothetical protein O181_013793 [Austropuccinia psidii MF-1]|uniref:Uncharacterized protein n=1 Tax=Austropuccinia psidii MF-1 TaxID=1389203 RepID=A0A9Q3BZE6_9BASI|nr:hypothetical protein [Austropuccinia psidii MF-1]